jgi:hypothetical protein
MGLAFFSMMAELFLGNVLQAFCLVMLVVCQDEVLLPSMLQMVLISLEV